MTCVAVFVDAGYLFAQGSTALTGSKKSRADLKLNETAAVSELSSAIVAKCGNRQLLRIYWYDGASYNRAGGLSLEHTTLAHTDYIKLRLGHINNQGQQKGVDSLIVTDLIELARNHAITDAVLMSGDEDVRIGVQIAQSFGVRVHLLGIKPSRGSQSILLLQEADTTTEWDKVTVAKFLSHKERQVQAIIAPLIAPAVNPPAVATDAQLKPVATALYASLDSDDKAAFDAFHKTERGLPVDIDGKLLAQARSAIGRLLDADEKRNLRSIMMRLLTSAN